MEKQLDLNGFFAYPSKPPEIKYTINSTVSELQKLSKYKNINSWEELDIPGKFIVNQIMRRIEESNIFIADITFLNFNVIYEIGYAIGQQKRIFLFRNNSIESDHKLIEEVGIFDTLGFEKYSDSTSLIELIKSINDLSPLSFDISKTKNESPVYLVLPEYFSDNETHLVSKIKKAKLFFRSYDPKEIGRLSAFDAIENVAQSHGVVIPLLGSSYKLSDIHNYRAAFVAGLTLGMSKVLLLAQSGNSPIPLDYRDIVKHYNTLDKLSEYVGNFAVNIIASIQHYKPIISSEPKTFLQKLNLGASFAENEIQNLSDYYLITDEFRSVERGEIQIVLGRKGSGKSALFFQLRDKLRSSRKKIVVDLNPEGFQLIKFKEQVLDYLEEGTREHTITAFWEYLLLLEICYKILQNDRNIYLRDNEIYELYKNLEESYSTDEYISEGDFAERLLRLTSKITDDFELKKSNGKINERLSSGEITNFLYKHDINKLRNNLLNYLDKKENLWVLFDNLDKGWPPNGITKDDVISLKCLLDAMRKIQKEFNRKKFETACVVFIRNDVYEKLIDIISDRGKISKIMIDWSDRSLLLQILHKRFLSNEIIEGQPEFVDIWRQICISHIGDQDSSEYFLDRSLMRPRLLIDFLKFCKSHAINLNHEKIELEDIEYGEETYSTQIIKDISYEIRDVFPSAQNLIYEFIESSVDIPKEKLEDIIKKITEDKKEIEYLTDLLLWYGVIGFKRNDGNIAYIFTVKYDMIKLKTLIRKQIEEGIVFYVNPAFWKGLEIKNI